MPAASPQTWTDEDDVSQRPAGTDGMGRTAQAGRATQDPEIGANSAWTDEDEADIVRTEHALEKYLYATASSLSQAETLRFMVDSCVAGLERMRSLKARLAERPT